MLKDKSGFALLYVFFFVIMLAGMIVAYLYMNSQNSASFGYKQTEAQAFYAAEAGQARAIQYLQNNWGGVWATLIPTGAGDLVSWYTGTIFGPITDTLTAKNSVTYDFAIDVWNLAYNGVPAPPVPFNGNSVTFSSEQLANPASRAIDGLAGNGQFWRSQPPFGAGEWIQVNFPAGANYSVNSCRFRSLQPGGGPTGQQRPSSYRWVITPVVGPPVFVPAAGYFVNTQQEVCDFFNTVSNVSSLRLEVAAVTGGNSVRIDEIEIPWIRIKSRCRVSSTSGTSYTEKIVRSCVLTNSRGAGAIITKITPSALSGTQMTAIWDEINSDRWTYSSLF